MTFDFKFVSDIILNRSYRDQYPDEEIHVGTHEVEETVLTEKGDMILGVIYFLDSISDLMLLTQVYPRDDSRLKNRSDILQRSSLHS